MFPFSILSNLVPRAEAHITDSLMEYYYYCYYYFTYLHFTVSLYFFHFGFEAHFCKLSAHEQNEERRNSFFALFAFPLRFGKVFYVKYAQTWEITVRINLESYLAINSAPVLCSSPKTNNKFGQPSWFMLI